MVEEGTGKKLMGAMTLPALKTKLADLKKDMNDETLPRSEREAAGAEWRGLLRAYKRGGEMRGQAGQAVDRVRKGIRNKIDDLLEAKSTKGKPNWVLQAFGAHLEEYLWLPSVGGKGLAGASGRAGCFIYEPPSGVVWRD